MDIRELRYFTQVARSGSLVRAASVLNVTQSAISRQLQKLEAGPILLEMRGWPPISITTDKLGSYSEAIRRLQRDGRLSHDVMHRTSKYLNNIIEADHGALKQVIRPARGFQTMTTAYATTEGFEICA